MRRSEGVVKGGLELAVTHESRSFWTVRGLHAPTGRLVFSVSMRHRS